MQDTVWFLSVFDTVHWVEWPDEHECVLFMQKSGEMAVISTLGVAILEALRIQPCSIVQLSSHISLCMDESVEEQVLALAIKSNLSQLQQIGAIVNDTNFITTHNTTVSTAL